MADRMTFEDLPEAYRKAMDALIADTYGEEYPEITSAWAEWAASSLHEEELNDAPDVNESETWSYELIAFVAGWQAAILQKEESSG